VTFGKYFQSNIDCHFDGSAALTFGDYVTVGAGARFVTGTHPIGLAYRRRGWEEKPNPIKVGDGAWIGCGAIIQADVAAGCIIAAGAIVTKPTEPNGLYAGAPARRIRDLGEE
jgi:maltose O-acetyltransferase